MAQFTKIGNTYFRQDDSGQLFPVTDKDTQTGLDSGHLPYSAVENNRGLTFASTQTPSTNQSSSPSSSEPTDIASLIKTRLVSALGSYRGVTDVSQLESKRQELLRKRLLAAPYSAESESTLTGAAKLSLLRARGTELDPEIKSLEEQIIKAKQGDSDSLNSLSKLLSIAKDTGVLGAEGYQSSLGKEYADYVADENSRGNKKVMTLNEYANMDANRKRAITGVDGGMTTTQNATFKTLTEQQSKSPLVAAADRTIVVDTVSKQLKKDPKNASLQLSFIYSFVQMLDTYQSAVREGEIGILSGTQGLSDKLSNIPDKIAQGTMLAPDVMNNYIKTAEMLSSSIKAGADTKRKDYASRAKVAGIEKQWKEYTSGIESKTEEVPETKIVKDKTTGKETTYIKVPGGWQKQ